jgi:DNA-binding NarL/FixJ family response regulator
VTVCVESGFEATGVWAALRARPTVCVVDADAPDPRALDAVQMVPRLAPTVKVLVLTSVTDAAALSAWRTCILDGLVVKSGGVAELGVALDAVLSGRRHFSAPAQRALFSSDANGGRPTLSRREAELLPLLARGLKLQDAAKQMQISYKTADSYRTSLLRKLGLRDRVELARYAIRERIISP